MGDIRFWNGELCLYTLSDLLSEFDNEINMTECMFLLLHKLLIHNWREARYSAFEKILLYIYNFVAQWKQNKLNSFRLPSMKNSSYLNLCVKEPKRF